MIGIRILPPDDPCRRLAVFALLALAACRGAPSADIARPPPASSSSAARVPIAPDASGAAQPPVDELRLGEGLLTTGTVNGDGDRVEIVAAVRPENAARLRPGLRVSFRRASVPSVVWGAHLDTVERANIRFVMDNHDRRLSSGMTGSVFVDLSPEPPPAPPASSTP